MKYFQITQKIKNYNLGPDIAFLYPDLTTALFGEFKNGMLVQAKEARISNIGENSKLYLYTTLLMFFTIYQRQLMGSYLLVFKLCLKGKIKMINPSLNYLY